jgi:hypothetical protein
MLCTGIFSALFGRHSSRLHSKSLHLHVRWINSRPPPVHAYMRVSRVSGPACISPLNCSKELYHDVARQSTKMLVWKLRGLGSSLQERIFSMSQGVDHRAISLRLSVALQRCDCICPYTGPLGVPALQYSVVPKCRNMITKIQKHHVLCLPLRDAAIPMPTHPKRPS